MDSATYAVESQVEQTHWWFVGRRRLFRAHIEALRLPADAAVLDVGTSTGTNLRLLKEMGFTRYRGLDPSPDAIRWCAEKGLGVVDQGTVAAIPFPDATFDLVIATDIIEHVDDDVGALAELRRVLKPGGTLLLTVPAFPSLWGLQDEVAHHKRRYRAGPLLERVTRAGLACRESYHFNFLLFVPIWLARQVIRLLGIRLESENQVNTPALNGILKAIFAADVALARVLRPPFGVSILALAERSAP
ncbi:MAG: class I SAM-dependent methyltransferase [Betaproteobacteria bacterium]|nr:class I SAM-dependent methyltransferase [Betaproteobacteria bacterium]